jgi:hypothetical protein
MKTITRALTGFAVAVLLASTASASSLETVDSIAQTMFTDLKVSDMALTVTSLRDAKSDPQLQQVLRMAPQAMDSNSHATAVYYRGQCIVLVDTRATNQDLRPDLQRLATREDVLFFVTAHELAHCVSQHRQAQELKQLAAGVALDNTFLPKEVIQQGNAGTLTPQAFAAIRASKATTQREEIYADVVAALYTRLKKPNADSILAVISKTRVEATEHGDDVHDTVAKLDVARKFSEHFALQDVVEVGHKLRM